MTAVFRCDKCERNLIHHDRLMEMVIFERRNSLQTIIFSKRICNYCNKKLKQWFKYLPKRLK